MVLNWNRLIFKKRLANLNGMLLQNLAFEKFRANFVNLIPFSCTKITFGKSQNSAALKCRWKTGALQNHTKVMHVKTKIQTLNNKFTSI